MSESIVGGKLPKKHGIRKKRGEKRRPSMNSQKGKHRVRREWPRIYKISIKKAYVADMGAHSKGKRMRAN